MVFVRLRCVQTAAVEPRLLFFSTAWAIVSFEFNYIYSFPTLRGFA